MAYIYWTFRLVPVNLKIVDMFPHTSKTLKNRLTCPRKRKGLDLAADIILIFSGQEESRSISENVTWGQRKRFADGKVMLPYGRFLGYEKGEDGLSKIVEKEAVIIRLIYKLFLEGKTPSGIARHLTANSIPTPSGKIHGNLVL